MEDDVLTISFAPCEAGGFIAYADVYNSAGIGETRSCAVEDLLNNMRSLLSSLEVAELDLDRDARDILDELKLFFSDLGT